jgi:glycosyltransferase involved in cell wall biosynthesis
VHSQKSARVIAMRIAFVCSSLEPGHGGVGDYTRRLAEELHANGHVCLCIALNDRQLDANQGVVTTDNSMGYCVKRWSSREPWDVRIKQVRCELELFQSDWISLQYVSWGYDARGLTHGLAEKLRAIIGEVPVHLMCHELWMEGPLFPLKHRILGVPQRIFFKRLCGALQPKVVHTQIPLYRDMLTGIGVSSEVLPLHGTISVSSSKAEGRAWFQERTGRPENEIFLGFFGAIYPLMNQDALVSLSKDYSRFYPHLSLVCGGNLSAAGLGAWENVKRAFGNRAHTFALGRLDEIEVSKYLCGLDLGLTSYPLEYVGKSASVATMLEHGLSVRSLGGSGLPAEQMVAHTLSPKDGCSVAKAAQRLLEALAATDSGITKAISPSVSVGKRSPH